MNLLISFGTYPRDSSNKTFQLLQSTFNSLIKDQDLSSLDIKIIVVGDDYPNIDELKPIFHGFDTNFYNINQGNPLRSFKQVPKDIIWKQCIQRTKIFILEKALLSNADYILMSSDDDLYCNQKITKSIEYIKKNNEPDFVFCYGSYLGSLILPKGRPKYPKPEDLISSGCLYKVKNKTFINNIIQFRKKCWSIVLHYISLKNKNVLNNSLKEQIEHYEKHIKPEDYQLWQYLAPFFIQKIFTAFLIPELQVIHDTEKTLYNFI